MVLTRTVSEEDYLEAIAKLGETEDEVGITAISKRLGVKKPSATGAINRLSTNGLVEHERYGRVELTPKGRKIAEDVIRRHEILFRFLSDVLGVDPETSQEDACKLEHWLSPESVKRLARFVDFALSCPEGQPAWTEGLRYYLEYGKRDPKMIARCSKSDNTD